MEIIEQKITNSRLLKRNGSWMYCTQCNKTIGYLCYTTYRRFNFKYTCKCGNQGHLYLSYDNEAITQQSELPLKTIKNRLCCPTDNSPLFSIVNKNLAEVEYDVVCKTCGVQFSKK